MYVVNKMRRGEGGQSSRRSEEKEHKGNGINKLRGGWLVRGEGEVVGDFFFFFAFLA